MKSGEVYQAGPRRRYHILEVGKAVVRYYSEADEAVRQSSRIQWELDVEWGRLVRAPGRAT